MTVLVGNGIDTYTNMERVYCSFVVLFGRFADAVIIGSMAQLVAKYNMAATRHQERSDIVNETARYLGVPSVLRDRIREYFDFLSACSHPGLEGMAMLGELSPPLHKEVLGHLYFRIVKQVPMFAGLNEDFLSVMVAKMQLRVYMINERVFERGELSREMYFLSQGTVEVTDKNDHRAALLENGAFFGELALVANIRRSATVRTLTVCDISVLSHLDLAEVRSLHRKPSCWQRQGPSHPHGAPLRCEI